MSGKKSMNKGSKTTKIEEPKKINLFSLLGNDDSEEETQNETTQQKKPSNIDENLLRNSSVVVAEEQMLNLNGVNMDEFLPTQNTKPKREKYIKYDEKVLEYKQIYDENKTYENIGNELKLNSYWTVWVHKSDNTDWTLQSYQKRYMINSIGSFWRFFNNFQFFDCYKNQLFIMRGEIAPIWEDVNNKFGGICSVKVDSTQRGFKTDISTEVFISICMLIMNETFIMNNEDINGISYTVKKRGILIKLWTKTYHKDDKFIDELPKPLFNKFNIELQKQLNGILGDNYKMSIQYKQIKPEYEIN
jgi:hypothetical protein